MKTGDLKFIYIISILMIIVILIIGAISPMPDIFKNNRNFIYASHEKINMTHDKFFNDEGEYFVIFTPQYLSIVKKNDDGLFINRKQSLNILNLTNHDFDYTKESKEYIDMKVEKLKKDIELGGVQNKHLGSFYYLKSPAIFLKNKEVLREDELNDYILDNLDYYKDIANTNIPVILLSATDIIMLIISSLVLAGNYIILISEINENVPTERRKGIFENKA